MVELKGYKINSISFENKVQNGTQLKLQNQFKYNVNYIGSQNKCLGILEFRVADADMNPFEIKIEMVAEFTYGDEDEYAKMSMDISRGKSCKYFRPDIGEYGIVRKQN